MRSGDVRVHITGCAFLPSFFLQHHFVSDDKCEHSASLDASLERDSERRSDFPVQNKFSESSSQAGGLALSTFHFKLIPVCVPRPTIATTYNKNIRQR